MWNLLLEVTRNWTDRQTDGR